MVGQIGYVAFFVAFLLLLQTLLIFLFVRCHVSHVIELERGLRFRVTVKLGNSLLAGLPVFHVLSLLLLVLEILAPLLHVLSELLLVQLALLLVLLVERLGGDEAGDERQSEKVFHSQF